MSEYIGVAIGLGIFLTVGGLIKWTVDSKKVRKLQKRIKSRKDFAGSDIYVNSERQMGIAINPAINSILLVHNRKETLLNASDLISAEIVEDNVPLLAVSNLVSLYGPAVIGGAFLGPVGALAGSLMVNANPKGRVYKVALKIVTVDFNDPNHEVLFLGSPDGCERSNVVYKKAIEEARRWHSRLIALIKRVDAERQQLSAQVDVAQKSETVAAPPAASLLVADELKKLAALRDNGMLSDEELAAQKAKLLSW